MVLFVSCMACSSKDISKIIFIGLVQIFLLRNSVVKPAIDTLCACTSWKIDAEVCRPFLFKFVSFGEASVDFRVALKKWWCLFHSLSSVCEVLIIPDVVVIISLYIGCVFLWLLYLAPGRFFHPFLHLLILEEFKELIFTLWLLVFGRFFSWYFHHILLSRLNFFSFFFWNNIISLWCLFLIILRIHRLHVLILQSLNVFLPFPKLFPLLIDNLSLLILLCVNF